MMKQAFLLMCATAQFGLAQATQPRTNSWATQEENNTITVFQKTAPGVVHIEAAVHDLQSKPPQEGVSTGTGFVISTKGEIITAFHVIRNSHAIQVTLPSGATWEAHVTGTAPQLDVVLLHINAPAEFLVALPFGDSTSLQVGQKVLAIGNALGLHNTLSVGVVSALKRDISDVPLQLSGTLIQTDAAINPGNSGGPLLNSHGEVIGMNDATIRGAQNIGFAIPVHLIQRILPDLAAMGHPYEPQLGMKLSELSPAIAALFDLRVERGLLVEKVESGSPAESAGFRSGNRIVTIDEQPTVLGGDIIVGLNGTRVTAAPEMAAILMNSKPGDLVTFQVLRDRTIVLIKLQLPPMGHETRTVGH